MSRKLGIEDPEQWLEDCTERVFSNWYAAYQVEPFGGEQELLARIASLLYLVACKGGVKLEQVSVASDAIMTCLMPSGWTGKRENKVEIDTDEVRKGFAAFEKVAEKLFS